MAFKLYVPEPRRSQSAAPAVTIRAWGTLGFNTAAVEQHKLYAFRGARLYYDDQPCRIGIVPTNNARALGFCKFVKREKPYRSVALSAKRFFLQHGLDKRSGEKAPLTVSMELGKKMLVAVLHASGNERSVRGGRDADASSR